jgi:hypothetical protein
MGSRRPARHRQGPGSINFSGPRGRAFTTAREVQGHSFGDAAGGKT